METVNEILQACILSSALIVGSLTLLHSEKPKLHSFGLSECNRVKKIYCCNEVFSILLLELSAMLLFSVACSQYDA